MYAPACVHSVTESGSLPYLHIKLIILHYLCLIIIYAGIKSKLASFTSPLPSLSLGTCSPAAYTHVVLDVIKLDVQTRLVYKELVKFRKYVRTFLACSTYNYSWSLFNKQLTAGQLNLRIYNAFTLCVNLP